MSRLYRFIFGLLLLWFGSSSIKTAYGGHEYGVFDWLKYFPFGMLLFSTVGVFLLESKYYNFRRNLFKFSMSIVGLLLCVIVLFRIVQCLIIDGTPNVLIVSNKAGASNVWRIEFKQNSRFRMTELHLLGRTIFYGRYKRSGDLLKIIGSNYRNETVDFPEMGTIKGDTVFWHNSDTMLIERK